jgi:hypothetical protein
MKDEDGPQIDIHLVEHPVQHESGLPLISELFRGCERFDDIGWFFRLDLTASSDGSAGMGCDPQCDLKQEAFLRPWTNVIQAFGYGNERALQVIVHFGFRCSGIPEDARDKIYMLVDQAPQSLVLLA